jgi:hypothetical protein
MTAHQSRRGTILILVAGISALLLILAMSFLVRMRSDAEETRMLLSEGQAHIMLIAGCSYIQEASRLGYDAGQHEEGYGWIDVRDGHLGPKPTAASADDDSRFPVNSVARCPMYVMHLPPYAIRLTAAYNPINTTPGSPDFGLPYLRNPDPQPVAANWSDFATGDPTPVSNSVGLSWFRVCRISGARFIVTCGAGGTMGWRDWTELTTVGGAAARAQFNDDSAFFDTLLQAEFRLWYEVEWSAAVNDPSYMVMHQDIKPDHFYWKPFNVTHEARSQPSARNLAGTIRWIQRLDTAPALW